MNSRFTSQGPGWSRLQDGGRFRIQFDLRASAIETVFIAPEYRMERFRFQRQMGIVELRYQPG